MELLDIATQIEYIFEKSQNIELKRLLLKFVFEKLTLNEGKLNYKLKFPFSEFVDNNILSEQVAKLHEPMQKQAKQGLQANNNEYLQIGCLKSIEPTQSLKNQGLAKNFANPLQIGASSYSENTIKLSININFFIEHSEEILEMKKQISLVILFNIYN